MINVEGIAKVLSDFKATHAKNSRVVMSDAPEMDELFRNFRTSARACFNDPQNASDAFSVMDNTHLAKDDELKRVAINRADVLMLLDDADSKGFKLFGKHNEKPGQYGILFTKKGVVALNRSGDAPGRKCGFISWEAHQFCRALLVDQRQSERTPPAAPRRCPVIDLVELITVFLAFSSPSAIFIALVSYLSLRPVDVPWAFI